MTRKTKIASILLYIISGTAILLGLAYTFTWKLFPYHEKFLGKTLEELDPKVAALFMQSMRLVGASCLAIGAGVAMLVKKFLAKGDNSVRWVILVMLLIYLLSILKVTLTVGISSPWWLVSIMIILTVTAFFLSKEKEKINT